MMRSTPVLAALIALGCLLSGKAQAASLEILPVTVTLAPGQTATTIEVMNRGGGTAAIQARAYSWTQAGDEDPLAPTQDIILSPPIFTIPEGASQTMRVLLRGGIGAGAERSYRLLLDEVPAANTGKKGIVIALRMSLPVIAASASSAAQTLQWRAERGPDGQTVLTAINAGQAYDRVGAIGVTLSDGSHPKVVSRATNSYVLPGAQRHWVVQGRGGVPGGQLRLSVTTQAGKTEQTLTP
jgi:fimbrial chaperone protein